MLNLTASLLLASSLALADPAQPAPAAPEIAPVVIEVSKETTFLDGPLLQDGTVDYVTAIDRINAKGVTKENNAIPLYWQAFGAGWTMDEPTRRHAANVLGVTPPAEEDHCLTTLSDLLLIANTHDAETADEAELPKHWQATRALLSKEDLAVLKRTPEELVIAMDLAYDLQHKATRSPWSAKEQATLVIWLKVNAQPIKLIEEASAKPRYYMPYVGGRDSTMMGIFLPALGKARQGGHVLCARAMHRIKEGNIEGAWQDYLTVSRMARHIAQEPILITQLVALSLDSLSHPVLMALLESSQLTKAQLETMATQFDKLGFVSDFERSIDLTERCMLLDVVGVMRRRGARYLNHLGEDEKPLTDEEIARNVKTMDMVMDSNVVLKSMNATMDDTVAIFRKPTARERLAAADTTRDRLAELGKTPRVTGVAMVAAAMLLPPEQRRKVTTEKMTQLILATVMPAITSVVKTQEQARMQREMSQVAFALAIYRAEHKTYPAALTELSPKYIAKVPIDHFDEKPLRYQRTEEGYLLYSIGADMKDDGGQNRGTADWTDIVIRLPPKGR